MNNREALEAALEQIDKFTMPPDSPAVAAARERLIQLPVKCETCGGVGEDGFDRNASHTQDRYVGYPCLICHGSGKVYPPETVEKIKAAIREVSPKYQMLITELVCERIAVAVLDALGETE